MISYPETREFRAAITTVKRNAHLNEENADKNLPILKFIGTVKLHGTNSALVYQKDVGHWCQSRNNILTPEKDNAGFAQAMDPLAGKFFHEHVLPVNTTIRDLYDRGQTVVIFGEWCGGNIQKHVAIFGLRKMFVIFKVFIVDRTVHNSPIENNDDDDDDDRGHQKKSRNHYWLEPDVWKNLTWHEQSIYNIYDFQTYEIDIDFNNPELSQNKLIEITNEVERECPVGAYFNQKGIGEGVVWTEWATTLGALRFKVKGKEHCVSHVKTLAPVNAEKLANLNEFIAYACTENRMLQGLHYIREQQLTIEMKNIGVFMKWLCNDIVKEESDTMQNSNINVIDVSRGVAPVARAWFSKQLS
jgi:hypothetical protein